MDTLPFLGKPTSQLGQGTWNMGDMPARRSAEIAALRRGIELGMTVLDTAEMYGSGRSESLVGEAIRGLRDQVTLVSKVLPSNASADATVRSCEASLKRLGATPSTCTSFTGAGAFRSPIPLKASSVCSSRARSNTGACPTST